MKILSAEQIREADAYTIAHEPVKSVDLMERAAKACVEWITHFYPGTGTTVRVFCGTGNNGGDGLAIARLLSAKKYRVEVMIVRGGGKISGDFRINEERLKKIKGITVREISSKKQLPSAAGEPGIIIDALFGTGLSGPAEGTAAEVIYHINNSKAPVISIDVPSGLFCDKPSLSGSKNIVKATHTLTFELPKMAFMFPENAPFCGSWHVLPISLDKSFIAGAETKTYYTDEKAVRKIYRPRQKFSHKGNYGHALLLSGSYGKMGAAILASRACLRAGAGLLTTHIPRCGYSILQSAVPEAMVTTDSSDNILSDTIKPERYNAIGIGPGTGVEKQTQNMLKLLIQNTDLPLVIDADAINILAENKTWLSFVPANSIYTPHPGEFERLCGQAGDDFERQKIQSAFAVKYGVYVVLKGAHTAIACPDGSSHFNSKGNPGMATAGSGDVLTGIITGLLAQGYSSRDACLLGVYLHGLAGDIAEEKHGVEALLAGDIIEHIGNAFQKLY